MEHEDLRDFTSHVFNWIMGGTIKEMYCCRLVRTKDWSKVEKINWLFFCITGEVMHCQKVYKRFYK